MTDRHPAVEHVLQFFSTEHLPEHLRGIAEECSALAKKMATDIEDNPELAAGLRKLLEAKDCFVRAKLAGKA